MQENGLDSFSFSKSPDTILSQGAFSAESTKDPISRLSREIDEENKEWRTFTIRSFLMYQAAVLSLQAALLQLCEPSPKISDGLSTILWHHDISLQNILVDDSGKPVAPLDWELMQMEPLVSVSAWPGYCMESKSATHLHFLNIGAYLGNRSPRR